MIFDRKKVIFTEFVPLKMADFSEKIKAAEQQLPLRDLKRMIGATLAKTDPIVATKLEELNLSAETLLARLNHIIKSDTTSVDTRIYEYNVDYMTRINNKINKVINPGREGLLIMLADSDFWGNAWPGSITPDSYSVTTNRYMIIAIKYSEEGKPTPYVYFFETVIEQDDFIPIPVENQLKMQFIETDITTLSLYQLIALAPSLYERLVMTLGGPRELLNALT